MNGKKYVKPEVEAFVLHFVVHLLSGSETGAVAGASREPLRSTTSDFEKEKGPWEEVNSQPHNSLWD